MAVQDARRLRELVSDYYHGLITPESYRQQRAELLDNIGKPVEPQLETTTGVRPVPPPAADAAPKPSAGTMDSPTAVQRPLGLVFGAIAVLGVGIVAVLLLTRSPDSDQNGDTPPQQTDISTGSSTNRGDALLQEFLSRDDWSEDSLANLATAWRALDDNQRDLAAEGRRYRRLTSALHQRIREESALGAAVTASTLQPLIELAVAIGASYRETPLVAGGSAGPPENMPRDEFTPVQDAPRDAIADVQDADVIDDQTSIGQQPVASDPTPTAVADDTNAILAPMVDKNVGPTVVPGTKADDPCSADLAKSRRPYCQDAISDGKKGPPLVVLPTGDFEMGSDGNNTEVPVHEATIANPIAMSRYEITSAEFEQFCASTSLPCPDRYWESDDYPVVFVSWMDAMLYTQWLTEQTGFNYRLPSEAEWEFAARAGTKSAYSFGGEITPSAAHSSANGPVDSPLPHSNRTVNRNPFRLYHMSGNVREWVQDIWYPNYEGAPQDGSARLQGSGDLRVVRGGSYSDIPTKLRSAAREPLDQSHRDDMTGFRVVREVMQATEK